MENKKRYFGTDGIRGRVGDGCINPEFVLKLGWAVGIVLGQGKGGKVLIGKDTRISGYMFESALEAGLSAAGIDIHLLGPMPTPAIAYLTRTFRAQAGIVISASHNLYYDNGIKFFSIHGTKIPLAIEQAIEQQISEPMTTVDSSKLGKAVRIDDAAGRYIEFCKSTVPHGLNLQGIKVVIDCANGATYYVAPHIFKELGAEVIPIGTGPNGLNINLQSGSTYPEILREKVLQENADLGIAFDGDGDRVIMVDSQGEIVDGDELLFIMARNLHREGRLVGGVVGTVMTNYGCELALQRLGINFARTSVGDRYVMEELQKLGWRLGGESSGHIVNLDLTTTGDGIISALQVLHVMYKTGKSLRELKSEMVKMPQVLINLPLKQPGSFTACSSLQTAIEQAEQKLGVSGRVLIRPSGTEPVVRVMVEGESAESVSSIAHELADAIRKTQVA